MEDRSLYSLTVPDDEDEATRAAEKPIVSYALVIFLGEEVRTFELPHDGAVTIGRAEDNQVRIDDPIRVSGTRRSSRG